MENKRKIKVFKNEITHGEKEYMNGKASYSRIFNRFIHDAVLCNNIINVDYELLYNQEAGFYSWEELRDDKLEELKEEYKEELENRTKTLEEIQDEAIEFADEEQYNYEFYQYFIINIDSFDLEYLKNCNQHTLQIMYSDILDCYILGVGHWGTSWEYVSSDFELEIIKNK